MIYHVPYQFNSSRGSGFGESRIVFQDNGIPLSSSRLEAIREVILRENSDSGISGVVILNVLVLEDDPPLNL